MSADTTAQPETNAEYHADFSHFGSTMLGDYDESPARCHALYVARTLKPDPPTPDMILGSLTHVFTFEPEKLRAEYVIAEGCNSRRGKKWDAITELAEAEAKTPVLPSQVDKAQAMAAAVRAHPLASTILDRAESIEQPIRWKDPETGLYLKCKPDCLVYDDVDRSTVLLPDLKTTSSLRKFPKSIADYRYHRQSRLYRDGVQWKLPDDTEIGSLWILVGKTAPYDVLVRRPSPRLMLQAAVELADVLGRLAESFATGKWELPESNVIETIDVPRWAQN